MSVLKALLASATGLIDIEKVRGDANVARLDSVAKLLVDDDLVIRQLAWSGIDYLILNLTQLAEARATAASMKGQLEELEAEHDLPT